jgi:hypothetical protein
MYLNIISNSLVLTYREESFEICTIKEQSFVADICRQQDRNLLSSNGIPCLKMEIIKSLIPSLNTQIKDLIITIKPRLSHKINI